MVLSKLIANFSNPIFEKNDVNKLNKDLTYIDCNSPIEVSQDDFSDLINDGKVYEMQGVFDSESLAIILEGVMSSTVVEKRIKDML